MSPLGKFFIVAGISSIPLGIIAGKCIAFGMGTLPARSPRTGARAASPLPARGMAAGHPSRGPFDWALLEEHALAHMAPVIDANGRAYCAVCTCAWVSDIWTDREQARLDHQFHQEVEQLVAR